ncbi:MAG: hypothetical protein ABI472_07200 [Ginsengibacter sp.]
MISVFIKNFLEPISYLVYAIAFLLEYRTHKSKSEKVLLVYYLVAFVLIFYACILALDYANNNNWLYKIYYFLSALVFGYFFNSLLRKRSNKIIVTILFSAVAVNFFVSDFVITRSYFDSAGNALFFLCVVVASLLYFHELLSTMTEKNILLNFNLWLISGYIVYFLGGFFIILSYAYFTDKFNYDQRSILGDLWSVQNVLLFITSIITLSSHIWIAYRTKSR